MKTSIIIQTPLEAFRQLPEGPPFYQLINGQIIAMPSPLNIHQLCLNLLSYYLTGYILSRKKGKVISAPFDVYLEHDNVFQPDLLFITNERYEQSIQSDGKLHGAPDWVAEILSPSTEKYDRNEKKEIYFRTGVQEYWLIDPEKRQIEIYTRDEGKSAFRLNQTLLQQGKIYSPLFPDWEIKAEDLFES